MGGGGGAPDCILLIKFSKHFINIKKKAQVMKADLHIAGTC